MDGIPIPAEHNMQAIKHSPNALRLVSIATAILLFCAVACSACTPASKIPPTFFAGPHSVYFTKDGNYVATGEWLHRVPHKNCVRLFDVATRKQEMKFLTTTYSMAMSPIDDNVVTGFAGLGFIVWNPSDGSEIRKVELESSGVKRLAFSPDGAILALGCLSNSIALYDAKTDKLLRRVQAHKRGEMLDLAFSPDGKFLVSTNDLDSEVRVWNASDLSPRAALGDNGSLEVLAAAFSPDSAFLATAGRDWRIRIYDAAGDFKRLGVLWHGSLVRDVAFAKDGTLASCSHDKTVRLWNVREQMELKSITVEDGDPGKLAFSPTEDLLVIAYPKKLLFWYYKTGEQREVRHTPGMIGSTPLPNDETSELPDPPAKPETDGKNESSKP